MLANTDHPTWTHTEFLEYLKECSSVATEALWESLGLIIVDLEKLDTFAQRCTTLRTSNEAGLSVVPSDPTRLTIETNLQHSIRKGRLEARLHSLKENNASLEELFQQRLPSRSEPQPRTPTARTKSKLDRYDRTQEAAGSLYRSFGMPCVQHQIHQTQLRLRTESGNPFQVKFTMTLQYVGSLSNLGHACHLGLTIDSQVTDAAVEAGTPGVSHIVQSDALSCKRKLHQEEQTVDVQPTVDHGHKDQTQALTKPSIIGKASDSKRLKARADRRQGVRSACPEDVPPLLPNIDANGPNFCDQSDFCTHVQHILTRGFTAGHPLGYLHTHEDRKHFIYLSSQTYLVSTKSATFPMESLRSLCINGGLSTAAIVSLSKQLSAAVLQYNATPWLEQWDSDHVLISHCGKTPKSLESDYFDSYLNVSISDIHQHAGDGELYETFVPNMTLFRLGIMLLELAYQKPLYKMQEASDRRPNKYDTAFATARRLRWRVSEKMGPRFADIVGKCIQCDFGHGQDLQSKRLQGCYYENVVQGLEDLETRFKHLDMSDLPGAA